MYAIPVTPLTLNLVEALNGGIRPEIEDHPTFFIFNTDANPRKIVPAVDLEELGDMKPVTIRYFA